MIIQEDSAITCSNQKAGSLKAYWQEKLRTEDICHKGDNFQYDYGFLFRFDVQVFGHVPVVCCIGLAIYILACEYNKLAHIKVQLRAIMLQIENLNDQE